MEVVVAATKDFASRKMIGVDKDGNFLLIANIGKHYYAIGNVCTHEGCALSDGRLIGAKVECPCHSSTFDVRTGKVLVGPAREPEPSFPTRLEGDQVIVTL